MDYKNFEDLSQEHQAFLAFLEGAKARLPPPKTLESLSLLLDDVHHAKEENLLFPLLFESEGEDKSGPKCTTFFTPRVMNSCAWQDPYHALFEKLGGDVPHTKQSAFRERVFSSGRMIRIPLEDHLLGEEAMKQMLGSEEAYYSIFPLFARMLRDHIEREDECLFPLLRTALNEEQKRKYAVEAAALDEKLGTANLLRQLIR